MNDHEFKIGDRVRDISDGFEGEIIALSGEYAWVKYEYDLPLTCYIYNLRPVESEADDE